MEINGRNTGSSFARNDEANCERSQSSSDLEDTETVQPLKFKARHIQMMALGFSLLSVVPDVRCCVGQ
jgi:amino acid permease